GSDGCSVPSGLQMGRMPGLPPRVFLLSPARAGGERMGLLLNPRAAFALASEFQQKGAAVGALFEFASGLYFRGKLAYARAFGRGPRGGSGGLAIVPGRGLMDVEQRTTADELPAIGAVPALLRRARRHEPRRALAALRACRDGAALRAAAGSDPPRPPPPKAPAVLMRRLCPPTGPLGRRRWLPRAGRAPRRGRGCARRRGLLRYRAAPGP